MSDHPDWFSIDDIAAVAYGLNSSLMKDLHAPSRMNKSYLFLMQYMSSGRHVYGMTTGLGSSSKNRLSADLSIKLQKNLIAYHGCGTGPELSLVESRGVMFLRYISLARGYSGVRPELADHLLKMLREDIVPVIPSRGSVGASGDLTPLSYLAAVVSAERECFYRGIKMPSSEAFHLSGMEPWSYCGREALALMNGTSMMTSVALLAWRQCRQLARVSCKVTGLLASLLRARRSPFLPEVQIAKGHPGQKYAASEILRVTGSDDPESSGDIPALSGIQDVYSIRCAPQLTGVLFDVLEWSRQWIEQEANSVNDNPVILSDQERVLNGGNFFGGHIAAATDSLKTASAALINLVDRQMALIMDPSLSSYFSENLVIPDHNSDDGIRHGFKGIQITLSALTAEIIKRSYPASVLSRSTESKNQDIVSMGTIAAVDLSEMMPYCWKSLAILSMATIQSYCVMVAKNNVPRLTDYANILLNELKEVFSGIHEDEALDKQIDIVADFLVTWRSCEENFSGENIN